MSKGLYFIPILAEALEQIEPETALKKAFEKIELMGSEPECRRGYLQFLRFMAAAAGQDSTKVQHGTHSAMKVIQELIVELASGTLDVDPAEKQSALELVRSIPKWLAEYEKLSMGPKPASVDQEEIEFILERDSNVIGTVSFKRIPGSGFFRNIVPGNYLLKIGTGRLLWEGILTAQDLLWTEAFPGRDFDLAAASWDISTTASREIGLLGGELLVRIYPGIEAGAVEVELRGVQGRCQ